MRIAFPIHGVGAGVGSEAYMLEIAERLANRGHELTMIVPGDARAPAWAAGVVRVKPYPASRRGLWRAQQTLTLPHQIQAAARARLRERPNVIMTGVLPLLFGLSVAYRDARRFYLPQSAIAWFELMSYGRPTLDLRAAAALYNRLQGWAWRRSDVVVSYVPSLTALRVRWFHVRPRRLVESMPGVDVQAFTPGPGDEQRRAAAGIPAGAPVVVTVGRLVLSKDIDFLLRAFAQGPPAAHLLVVGSGPDEERLRRVAGDLGLASRVHFAGFRADVADCLRLGDVFAFPSRLESFGLALAQALAAGLPAVARRANFPDVITMSESIIDDGQTGYLVDTEAEMASAITRLLAHPEKRLIMGTLAAARARAMFNWERHVDAIDSALSDLGDGGRQRR